MITASSLQVYITWTFGISPFADFYCERIFDKIALHWHHGDIAVPVLQKLQNLSWSATIYPNMPKYLQQLLTEAGKG